MTDDNEQVLASVFYDVVQVKDSSAAGAQINSFLQADYKESKQSASEYSDRLNDIVPATSSDPFKDEYMAWISYSDSNYLCVTYAPTKSWRSVSQ